ncbi:MAG TPA: branched-chain amino acid ABC transporter substrate-binding protein [Candidatus Baltobacteraceae bacterium]|nr:branched-chain amino acid ABC transporter substrate-binding protein [Candidatus Baltobacteraceae bacterium]
MHSHNILARLSAAALLAALAASSGPLALGGSASAADAVIKIGIDLPVSGGDAAQGIPTRNGAVLAIEQANARHATGGFQLQAYDLDDAVQGAHDPAQGAQNVKNFVSDAAVVSMFGPFNSSVAKAEIPIANDAGLAMIAASTTNPGLTKGEDAKKLRISHPDVNVFFRVCTTDDRQGAVGARFARKFGYKKVFVVDDNETYGKGLADVFDASFKSMGGTVLGHEHLTKGQTDFKALLTKIAALGPDVVFFGGTTVTGGGLLRKQMGDSPLKSVTYFGGDGISDATFLTTAGAMATNVYYTVAAPDSAKLPTAQAFIAAYKKRWNTDIGAYSANAYSATMIEIAAIEKAMKANGGKIPTRAEVLKNIAATKNFDTPIGKIGFDANGDTVSGILSLYKITDGKAEFVDQVSEPST